MSTSSPTGIGSRRRVEQGPAPDYYLCPRQGQLSKWRFLSKIFSILSFKYKDYTLNYSPVKNYKNIISFTSKKKKLCLENSIKS